MIEPSTDRDRPRDQEPLFLGDQGLLLHRLEDKAIPLVDHPELGAGVQMKSIAELLGNDQPARRVDGNRQCHIPMVDGIPPSRQGTGYFRCAPAAPLVLVKTDRPVRLEVALRPALRSEAGRGRAADPAGTGAAPTDDAENPLGSSSTGEGGAAR